jgi:hypothetical protein
VADAEIAVVFTSFDVRLDFHVRLFFSSNSWLDPVFTLRARATVWLCCSDS